MAWRENLPAAGGPPHRSPHSALAGGFTVAECGVLRALRIELTPWVLAGTQLVGRPLRALSWGAGLNMAKDLRFTIYENPTGILFTPDEFSRRSYLWPRRRAQRRAAVATIIWPMAEQKQKRARTGEEASPGTMQAAVYHSFGGKSEWLGFLNNDMCRYCNCC